MYSNNLSDEIRLWWDHKAEMRKGLKYKVIVNNKNSIFTERNYYNFKSLKAGTEYSFEVKLIDENQNQVGESLFLTTTTLPEKERIDVTKPPYNAVGDGITDNTKAIRQAFIDCTNDKCIYFPLGIYVCDSINFSGDKRIIFDTGAAMCTLDEVKKL